MAHDQDQLWERLAPDAPRTIVSSTLAPIGGLDTDEPLPNQSVIHSGFDVMRWNEADRLVDGFTASAEKARDAVATGLALERDLFFSLEKSSVIVDASPSMEPAFRVNAQIMTELTQTSEWRDLHATTQRSPVMAGMATIAMSQAVISMIDSKTRDDINKVDQAEQERKQEERKQSAMEQIAKMRQQMADAQDKSTPQGQQEALENHQIAIEAQAASAQAGAAAAAAAQRGAEAQASIDAGAEQRGQAIRRALRPVMKQAEADAEGLASALDALSGGGFGWGQGGDGPTETDPQTIMKVAQKLQTLPWLAKVMEIAGRMIRIAWNVRETKTNHIPEEISAINLGRDLTRTLPSELALLSDPDTKTLFVMKYASSSLMQFEMTGHEKLGRGPIEVVVDDSGSMMANIGGLEARFWAAGVAMAMLPIARADKRDLNWTHFGGSPRELKTFAFPKGHADPLHLLACLELFYGHGTDYEPWMQQSMARIEKDPNDKSDVICISDGIVGIPDQTLTRYNKLRETREMRSYGILIGTPYGKETLDAFCDQTAVMMDLMDDQAILEVLFAI